MQFTQEVVGDFTPSAFPIRHAYLSPHERVIRRKQFAPRLNETVAAAHESGFVSTILGRKRYIPELSSNNFADRAYGERIAANTPIQGSAADICKLAMLEINRRFKSAGFEAQMVLQIHDVLLFEVPRNEVAEVTDVVRQCMEQPYELDVPLKVDIGTGASWAEAH